MAKHTKNVDNILYSRWVNLSMENLIKEGEIKTNQIIDEIDKTKELQNVHIWLINSRAGE